MALRESVATPAELAAAIDAAAPWPLRHARYPGSALVARMAAALELLGARRLADAHAAELGAVGPPAGAKASPPAAPATARAALALARAAVAAATCPLHPEGGAQHRSRSACHGAQFPPASARRFRRSFRPCFRRSYRRRSAPGGELVDVQGDVDVAAWLWVARF